METIKETQTQMNKVSGRWQIIGMCIGLMIGFLYPQVGLGVGMILGIALGRLALAKIPLHSPLAQRAQKRASIIAILAFFILFINHWYGPFKYAIANLMN